MRAVRAVPDVLGWLLDPYAFEFMRRALAVLLIVSVVGAVVGAFVVHKGLAFSGDALAHATLAGVAVAFVNGASVGLGALVAAVVTALGVGWMRRRTAVSYDTAIGILFVAMFSLGILVLSRRTAYTPDLLSFVFGNILGVSRADLVGALLMGAAVLLFVWAFYRELLFVAYDPAMAAASGVRSALFQYALLVMIAVAVVVALKAIGIVLVNALLIIPAATAAMLSHRLSMIMLLGALIAAAVSAVGLHVSYYAGVAASPAIVLAACAAFALAALVSARRGSARRSPAYAPPGATGVRSAPDGR
ncbi:MAG: metal ABC transporter permease [Dehalococcoidia bacterium]|nr:metal ABC transporter permease [Dehalococcoidia bacterium]